jgi:hypothetical protein
VHGVFVHAEGLVRIGLTGFPGFGHGCCAAASSSAHFMEADWGKHCFGESFLAFVNDLYIKI